MYVVIIRMYMYRLGQTLSRSKYKLHILNYI